MSDTCEIRTLFDQNREDILASLKKEAASKDYFAGLNLPPAQVIDMVVKDYLETIIICYETGSLATFEEKLNWFYPMYQSRRSDSYSGDITSDFFGILRSILIANCPHPDPKLLETLDRMEALIDLYEKRPEK